MYRSYRRPRISVLAEGLFAALEADRSGDHAPLEDWFRTGFPALRDSLRTAGFDAAGADGAATAVLEKACVADRAGHPALHELAWMARVAEREWIDGLRERSRLSRRFATAEASGTIPAGRGSSSPDESDVLEALVAAVERLPSPYRDAMGLLRIDGRSRASVQSAIQAWWRVGIEGARRILRVGNGMLEATLKGEDPRALWPKRYAQESVVDNLWKRTPPGGRRRLSW